MQMGEHRREPPMDQLANCSREIDHAAGTGTGMTGRVGRAIRKRRSHEREADMAWVLTRRAIAGLPQGHWKNGEQFESASAYSTKWCGHRPMYGRAAIWC